MPIPFANEFTEQCILRMSESMERIGKCLGELNEEEVWKRPNSQLSSIGNLVLHLCGNIRQYAISSLGGVDDTRNRNMEFEATGGYTTRDLHDKISATIEEAMTTIARTTEEELLRVRTVQGFSMSGIGIVIHVTEHLSYHTGQIAFYTKMLKEKDLGFYAGIDLEVKND